MYVLQLLTTPTPRADTIRIELHHPRSVRVRAETALITCPPSLPLQVVCDFCEEHLEANKAAFKDPRLQLVVDDARAQLENWPGTFDVIIGDLADPVYGGPCYQVHWRIDAHVVLTTRVVLTT